MRLERVLSAWKAQLVAGATPRTARAAVSKLEEHERSVRGKGAPCQSLQEGLETQYLPRPHEHPAQPHRAVQGGVVCHRVGARPGGNPEAAIEQPVPDGARGQGVAEAERLVVVDRAEGHVPREADGIAGGEAGHGIGGEVPRLRRLGHGVEGMDVAHEPALGAGQAGNGRVRRSQAGGRGVDVAGVVGEEDVVAQAEQPEVPPPARVEFLVVADQGLPRRSRPGRAGR
jgi:hypothetical protein